MASQEPIEEFAKKHQVIETEEKPLLLCLQCGWQWEPKKDPKKVRI